MTSSAFTQKRMSTKRKSPEDDRASEAFHPHYYAGESRVYAYTPIIAAASSAVKWVWLGAALLVTELT